VDVLTIEVDDARVEDVRALIGRHLAFTTQTSPPEDMHALGIEGLVEPSVTLYSARREGRLLAVGALKRLDGEHAELKSMHTAAEARGRGIGRAMLLRLLSAARDGGYRRISLETGSMAEFAPARALYASAGFEVCGPFADYVLSPYSTFMSLSLHCPSPRVLVRRTDQ
jgi:putative acetyltransferase